MILRVWAISILFAASVKAYYTKPPNIVFIMVDDMGWNDVSFHGSDQIQTPNLDTLAYQGTILQQYYSEAICTPARSALLTGKYPMRVGMHGRPLSNLESRGIPENETLLPSYLKELGYTTHLVGKWHVGMSRDDFLPTARGYDSHYGLRGGYVDYYTYNHNENYENREFIGLDLFDNDIEQDKEERYIIDALTDRAVKIIHHHNGSQPLFLHVAHNAPHSGNDGSLLQPPPAAVRQKHIANSNRRLYAEIVAHLDRSVGRLVRALAESDMLEDTVIVFMSDNGAPTIGQFNNYGVNLPLRGIKDSPWEGAVRVPAFIWYSKLTPRIWHGLMHVTDWLPTLVAIAGGELRGPIDGVDQWPSILTNGESTRKEVLVSVYEGSNRSYAAYRAGDYKIIVGNLTGTANDYYGINLTVNKNPPPDYFTALESCDVAETLKYTGRFLDYSEIMSVRQETIIKQQDPMIDDVPCLPTTTRGCLYNIRKDPLERHDLWRQASRIATLMTSRLRGLWALRMKRVTRIIEDAADPANFGYTYRPWVKTNNTIETRLIEEDNVSTRNSNVYSNGYTTIADRIDCEGPLYRRNFLCILRNIF